MTLNSARSLLSTVAPQNPSNKDRLLFGSATVALNAVLGASYGHLFLALNPLTGAIFAGSQQLVYEGMDYAFDKLEWNNTNTTSLMIAKWATSFFISLGAAFLITNAIGFPIVFTAGFLLSLNILMTNIFEFVNSSRLSESS